MVCGDTRASFDIINGTDRPVATDIPPPTPSEELQKNMGTVYGSAHESKLGVL